MLKIICKSCNVRHATITVTTKNVVDVNGRFALGDTLSIPSCAICMLAGVEAARRLSTVLGFEVPYTYKQDLSLSGMPAFVTTKSAL
jgi:hypothetical protein